MSTPSTATAPLPPHSHYGQSYHQSYQSTSSQHSPNDSLLSGSSRLAHSSYNGTYPRLPSTSTRNSVSSTTKQMPTSQSQTATQSSTSKMPRNTSQKQPDWREFYKNGVPSEIIVIDDDTPPPKSKASQQQQPRTNNYVTSNRSTSEHVNKKRKTAGNYDSTTGQSVYTDANTPQYAGSGSETISTDRTTSLHTTAPTSLGSHGSRGAEVWAEVGAAHAAGQKRKRVTRQSTSDTKKRRELENDPNPYNHYIPPSKPLYKSKEVQVKPIKDNALNQTRVDDDDGHFIVQEGAHLTAQYQIVRLLGQGTFGKVVEAVDKVRGERCAIKIIRSVQKYRDASRIELRVLSTLAQNDRTNRNKCIHLKECFDVRNHICIVTDLLGQSVFDFLKSNSFVPFPSSQIQNFARQLLTSVAFLHDLQLIHTDLKPENILLVSNSYQTFTYNKNIPSSTTQTQRTARQRRVLLDTEIRLIDFGSATFDDEYHSSVVSTRHYRAPEIILNLGWSFPCDIWSVGCILVEFYTGDALFQTHDNLEHLAMMEAVVGSKIEPKLVKAVSNSSSRGQANAAVKFFKNGKLDYPGKDCSKASRNYVRAMKSLQDIIPPNTPFNKAFLDLLKKIFVYDPSKRITAKEALNHPWFRESLIDDGTEATRIKKEREARQINGHR